MQVDEDLVVRMEAAATLKIDILPHGLSLIIQPFLFLNEFLP
jgi:hypothetical protein